MRNSPDLKSMNYTTKTFIEEKTREVLIVAQDGCYTYKSEIGGDTKLVKLNEVREILSSVESPGKILPG